MKAVMTVWQLRWQGLNWLALYTVLWFLLTGGAGWGFGLFCVLAAASISLRLGLSPYTLQLRHLPGFIGFFFRALWSGGWDVARRAYNPTLPLNPGWVSYPLTHNYPRVSLVLSAMVGLLPGTLCSRIVDQRLLLHVLDTEHPWQPTVSHLEARLLALLGAKP